MKRRLVASFGGVADRKRKHLGKKASGIWVSGHPGGGLTGRSWVSWLGEPSLGPWYPQCPPFSVNEEDHPRSKKKEKEKEQA